MCGFSVWLPISLQSLFGKNEQQLEHFTWTTKPLLDYEWILGWKTHWGEKQSVYSISLLFPFENFNLPFDWQKLTHTYTTKVFSCVNLLSINPREKQMYARYLILIFPPKWHDTKVCVICIKKCMLFLFLVCSCLNWLLCLVLCVVWCVWLVIITQSIHIRTRQSIRSVIHVVNLILFGCVYHFFVLSVFLSGANIFLSFPLLLVFEFLMN